MSRAQRAMLWPSLWLLATAFALAAGLTLALAQETGDASEKEIERYRQMLKADPWSNPAMLDVDRGEALWKTPRGPKGVSLEGCDLGKGPGVVKGAFAELPRYFRRCRPRHGRRSPHRLVHGKAAGLRYGGSC